MPIRPYILKETHWKTVRKTEYDVAVLPWGATEAHNFHLPYGTDIFEADDLAAEAARLAWKRGAKIVVLPAIPFGANNQQMDIKLTINMNPSTQAQVLADVAESLETQGIPKLVVFNSHGGNDFRQMIRELQSKTRLFLCNVNWFQIPLPDGLIETPGDHADERETSLMMYLEPQFVLPLRQAGDGHSKQFKIPAFREKWAWAPRQWTRVTDDTGVGNPKAASAEKGQRYFEYLTQTIADFFVELAQTDPQDMYAER